MRRAHAWALAVLAATLLLAGCHHDSAPPTGSTTFQVQGAPVHAVVRGPSARDAKATVLFLHGQAYSSKVWVDRGILDAVAEAGYRAVAVDLPGHGDTPEQATAASRGDWLLALVAKVGDPRDVVVVSPSMSGSYSLAMLELYPTMPLLGFVPVAPVGIDDFARPPEAPAQAALGIWGSEDPSYTPGRAAHLVDELGGPPAARTRIIPDASHAAYDDHPEEFTALLLGFLDRASR